MDSNKKEGRNENGLIRMSATARDFMGFGGDKVELWPEGASGEDRINKSIMLSVFHAFKADISELKKKNLPTGKYRRVGFVTTKMFNRICGGKKQVAESIWISNDISDAVLGADPEFLLVNDEDYVVNAQDLLGKNGDFGGDGAMCEIRPKPETSVHQLVENMRSIFDTWSTHDKAGKYRWLTTVFYNDGDRGYPCGGHIHVGNPKQLMAQSSQLRGKAWKVLNKIMDEYLALPLMKLDGPDGKQRRLPGTAPMGPFGHFGGMRTDLGRLEHRTLSGIWILHPSLSRAVLGAAKAVVDETFLLANEEAWSNDYILPGNLNRHNVWSGEFDQWDKIPLAADMNATLSSGKMIDVLHTKNHTYWTAKRIADLHKKFKGLSTYKENSHYIDGLIEILKIKYDEFSKFEREIQKNWLGKKKFIVDV